MRILGISAFYHDSAAALIEDGRIVAAAQEERFTRVKADASFPARAIDYCLRESGGSIHDVDRVVYYEDPVKKFDRLLTNFAVHAPRGYDSFAAAMRSFLPDKLRIPSAIQERLGFRGKVEHIDHHLSHAASAFYPSPFQRAAILCVDGVGEWATVSIGRGDGPSIVPLREQHYPHSVGMLYSAFTLYTGFKVNFGEYKLMGLAPYGEPRYADLIRSKLVHVMEDGSIQLNLEHFDFCTGGRMISPSFEALFGGPARAPEAPITQKEMDLAKSIQVVTEDIVLRLARTAKSLTGEDRICLAGGVALNCVANGKLLKSGLFKDVFIQPAAGDAGGALGCALYCWHGMLGNPRSADGVHDAQKGSYLGPRFSREEIRRFLDAEGIPYTEPAPAELAGKVAELLAQGKVVGLFQGRMEYGPRALGNRSILGDPRSADMQRAMNLKIKYRESFRPFAPSVLEDRADAYFDLPKGTSHPYMLLTTPVQDRIRVPATNGAAWGLDKLKEKRSSIPAVTHVDYSARVQTVSRDRNPFFHAVLERFDALTGCPVLVNTSFNVRGEPIVCSHADAYRCFMRTEMDHLVLEGFLLDKTAQRPLKGDSDWRSEIPLD